MKKQGNGCGFSHCCARFARAFRAFARKMEGQWAPLLFTAAVALALVGFSVCAMGLGERAFLSVFHKGATSPFADFFSSVRDATRGAAVYSERRVIYPPLANAIFWAFSRLMPSAYLEGPMEDFGAYSAPLLAFFAFFALSLALVGLLLAQTVRGVMRFPLAGAAVVSFPMLFLLERGNLAVLSLAAILLFVRGCNSPDKGARELGLFALGFAAALKIYPLLFALPLLRERRFREAGRAALWALALFLIPSFFFGGPLFCAAWILKNTLHYSAYAARGVTQALGEWGVSAVAARVGIAVALALLLMLLLWRTLWGREVYKTWAHLAATLLCIPSIFSAYNWVLFLPSLLAFFEDERLNAKNAPWFLAIATPFCLYLPKAWQDPLLIALMGSVIALSVVDMARQMMKKRQNGA